MSASNVAAVPAAKVEANQVLVQGRVEDVREWESGDTSGYVTTVKLPAADQYSSAATVEVSSRRKIGKGGEEIRILCNLGGFRKRVNGKDFVNMRLVAVE